MVGLAGFNHFHPPTHSYDFVEMNCLVNMSACAQEFTLRSMIQGHAGIAKISLAIVLASAMAVHGRRVLIVSAQDESVDHTAQTAEPALARMMAARRPQDTLELRRVHNEQMEFQYSLWLAVGQLEDQHLRLSQESMDPVSEAADI